jgi:hypothetical protein
VQLAEYIVSSLDSSISSGEQDEAVREVKMIGFVENLLTIIEQSGSWLTSDPLFASVVKSKLVSLIPTLLLTPGLPLMKKTANLFLGLFRRFLPVLKKELYMILDVGVIGLIRNPTISFFRRQFLLSFLSSLLGNHSNLLAIFSNYDCCIGYGNLLNKIIETLRMQRLPQSTSSSSRTPQTSCRSRTPAHCSARRGSSNRPLSSVVGRF